ncbi:MAG: hypothetical protein FWC57_03945 [Endomicrobia bacterium]|nr:hypothetical protein [Endomicrobiia bacterium]
MRNIKIVSALILLVLSLTPLLYAQSNQINVTNGAAMDTLSNDGQYKNSSSVNDGIVVSQRGMDFNFVTGHLAAIKVINPNIVFYAFSSTENVTSATMDVGITVQTSSGNIRTVGYKISQTPPTDETGPFTFIYTAVPASTNTVSVSTTIIYSTFTDTNGHIQVQTGTNYIQWFAQSDSNPIGNTATFQVTVTAIQNKIIISQPNVSALPSPHITAGIVSPSTFTASDINIYMLDKVSGSTVSYTTGNLLGNGVSVSSDHLSAVIDYKYNGVLISGKEYILMIAVHSPGDPRYLYSTSIFTVSSDPIPVLIPYPSPYNPKNGLLTIKYVLSEPSYVTINIYDRAGRIVKKLVSEQYRRAGVNDTDKWDSRSYSGDSLASGVYICEIIAKGSKENRRYVSFAILRK